MTREELIAIDDSTAAAIYKAACAQSKQTGRSVRELVEELADTHCVDKTQWENGTTWDFDDDYASEISISKNGSITATYADTREHMIAEPLPCSVDYGAAM